MIERPILFSAPMVRAVRDGRKTQTRRTRGLYKVNAEPDAWRLLYSGGVDGVWWTFAKGHNPDGPVEKIRCPYGVAGGDRLWTRESGKLSDDGRIFIYSATPGECKLKTPGDYYPAAHSFKSVPSIHMPRWASRDTLEVICARPERLQAITEEDARAEGCSADEDPFWKPSYADPDSGGSPSARNSFEYLWHEINGAKSWMENPWAWRIEFRRLSA